MGRSRRRQSFLSGMNPSDHFCLSSISRLHFHPLHLLISIAFLQYGLLAGGLADGSVCIWNPARIIGQPPGASPRGQLLCRLQKHQGGVRGLEFNPFSPNLLASGASDGELCIWDVGNPAQPSLYPAMKGAAAGGTAGGDITCLAWNRKVQHILGTATIGGTVVVWDLKKQRPVISFKDPAGRRRCSAVAWNPEVATQLIVASDDDSSPALQLWDLRNSVSPLMELHGHSKGVLAVSWCPQDASLLLSSSKDNRIIVWDATTGQPASELPPATNWKFDVQWAPGKAAGVFGGATFEGKVTLHSLGSCQAPAADPTTGYQPPRSMKPPAWMKRPAGATFGFGGKLVKFTNSKRQLPTGEVGESGTIEVKQITVGSSVPDISPEFEQVIRSADKDALRALCQTRASEASSPQESETWTFLQTHFESDGRHHLLAKLGFEGALPKPLEEQHTTEEEVSGGPDLSGLSLEQQSQAAAAHQAAVNLLVNSGGVNDDGSAFFAQSPVDAGGSFFDSIKTPREGLSPVAPPSPPKSARASGTPRITEERPIVDGPPGEGEEEIHTALLVGNYDGAVEACLRHGRHADALITASLVGGETWEKARKEYMYAHPRPYMRVVHSVLSGDWASFVAAQPPPAWKQTLAALLTSAPYDQFESLVATLAGKLAGAGIMHAATLCYVCSGDVESAVKMWTKAAGPDAPAAAKEAVMEKAVVLGLGVDRTGASSALGDLLARHAEGLAATGRLSAAYDLLTLVPGDTSTGAAVLRDRLYRSGAVPQAAAAPPPFPFTPEGVVGSSTGAAGGVASAAPSRTSAAGGGYGSAYGQQAAAKPQQQVAAPTYGAAAAGYGAPAAQTYQPQQNGYGGGGYGASAVPPPTAPPPATFQPSQPAMPQPGAGGYGAPPPPTGPPTTFQPTSAAPTPMKPTPPQVFQHPGAAGGGGPPQGMQGMQMQMHQPHGVPPSPSPRASQMHQAPPTVFQPSAGPPTGGMGMGMGMVPPPSQPPPMGMMPQQGAGGGGGGYQSTAAPPPPQTYQHTPAQSHMGAPTQQAQHAPLAPTVYQPSSVGQQPQLYGAGSGAIPSPQQAAAPPPPPPRGPPADISIATADTSAVPAELRPVVNSLTGLFQACEAIAGAHPARRRELDDASKKIGALLWRLNEGEVSPSVGSKLLQLCAAVDVGDYPTAGHVQVQLTTADWDECSPWLTALKRLIKLRQTG